MRTRIHQKMLKSFVILNSSTQLLYKNVTVKKQKVGNINFQDLSTLNSNEYIRNFSNFHAEDEEFFWKKVLQKFQKK